MCFSLGAVLYGLIELVARGRTHWTMALAGGTIMVLLYVVNRSGNLSPVVRCLLGTLMITCVEFAVGMIVNVRLGWEVWDYSSRPFNLYGQICPRYTAYWFLLCVPAYALCDFIKKKIS